MRSVYAGTVCALTATLGLLMTASTSLSTEEIDTPAPLPEAPGFSTSLRDALEKDLASRGANYVPRTRHRSSEGRPLFTNRLLLEKSPYLQQHAHNPVNWFPWGPEAFTEARRLGRPVLVSIGYSTCHWCHVME